MLASSWCPWKWGETYDAAAQQAWWSEHEEYPMLTVGLYLCIVFNGPKVMSQYPLGPVTCEVVKTIFVLWNLGLASFSWFGMFYVVPHLFKHVRSHGFYYTVCAKPEDWYTTGKVAFWLEVFILSKFPELLDTVFLVLQNKRVIFLHWYHHVTVLLFCWQAYIRNASPGLWYCAMNYCVHAFMYLYYAGMAVPSSRRLVQPWSIFITVGQILQMVMGAIVTLSAAGWWVQGVECNLRQSTCCLGVVVYASYLGLFVALFVDKYCGRCKPCGNDPCMGELSKDSAGMFRGASSSSLSSPVAPAKLKGA
mmetsp:Transcript_32492/g.75516  ORF Transcript_32492/g.75516 Transcript_32492/m.75516 type:complete len:307 (-) Transcript_32492:77-997(-)